MRYLRDGELATARGVSAEYDIPYIPMPNTADVVLSDLLAPDTATPTAFVFPFFDNGDLLLARNRRRDLEVPGGHRDMMRTGVLEHPSEAARREAREETGAELAELVPVGFMRSVSRASKPVGYRYPFPVSCQQFFAARIADVAGYTENDECLAPMRVTPDEALDMFNRRTVTLYVRAREILFPRQEPSAGGSLPG